jgi:hypothetical protein
MPKIFTRMSFTIQIPPSLVRAVPVGTEERGTLPKGRLGATMRDKPGTPVTDKKGQIQA